MNVRWVRSLAANNGGFIETFSEAEGTLDACNDRREILASREELRAAFDKLGHQNQNYVFHYCAKRLGKTLGEEIAQEVILVAWKKWEKQWEEYKKEEIGSRPNSFWEMARKEQASLLAQCVSELDDVDKILVRLRFTEEFSIGEIASIMDRDRATVYRQIKRAREHLWDAYERKIQ